MKFNLKYLTILLAGFVSLYSCDDDTVTYDEIALEVVDGFYRSLTPNVAFVAGTESYEIQFIVVPGVAEVTAVEVYKKFNDSKTGNSSDEILLGSYDVNAAEAATTVTDNLTFDDLRSGLTLNGGPLPTDELEIGIGSSWTLTLVPVTAGGEEAAISNAGGTINVAVLSPFAGDYVVTESAYFRIDVESGLTDWTGQVNFIGSVNDSTFSHPDWWGPFAYPGAFNFIVRSADNSVWIPKVGEVPGVTQELFSGNWILNCEEDASFFDNVPCVGSNVLLPDGGGEHVFRLTYGYYTDSDDENEGDREFFEELTKIVE